MFLRRPFLFKTINHKMMTEPFSTSDDAGRSPSFCHDLSEEEEQLKTRIPIIFTKRLFCASETSLLVAHCQSCLPGIEMNTKNQKITIL